MKTFKFFWTTHKWVGIIAALLLCMISVTGFLLLIKKDVAWIQPPTQTGSPGDLTDYLPLQEVLAAAFAAGHEGFRSIDDIERLDFRPKDRVHKIRSRHDYAEIQVDAITGDVLSIDVRRSDLIERIHDGSFFGDWAHRWLMPALAVSILFLVFSGLWLWIEPFIRRRARRRSQRSA